MLYKELESSQNIVASKVKDKSIFLYFTSTPVLRFCAYGMYTCIHTKMNITFLLLAFTPDNANIRDKDSYT